MSVPPQSEKLILDAARRLEAEERTVFLEKTCGADTELRQRVESLLATDTKPYTPSGPGGTVIADSEATLGATTEILPAEEAPGDCIGRYKLLEKIGEGGFGMVYVAEQTEPVKRRVALKIIKLGMDTRQVVARFEAERQALALMDHPNIAKVLDAGATDTGRPYFVMELVRGTKITEYCDRNKLSTRRRLDLFMLVCRAIEHAHQKGIIHRDIKPSNILVTLQDGAPVPKVIDFGIAKATQGSLTEKMVYTQIDQFVGTPAYMSPEQAEAGGLDIDTRSDIYSLGILLYELLTGETPLEAKNLLARGFDEMRKLIREWEPQLPSMLLHKRDAEDQTTVATRHGTDAPKLIKMVRGDLDWVVMKCLEKDRARRYDSAAELTAEIERFLANEPVSARPPSKVYRFEKLVRRNRLAFAAGGAILVSLIIGLVVTSWFVVKEKNERDMAEKVGKAAERDLDVAVAERAKAEKALAQTAEAHKQSSADQQLSLAAESRAEASRKDAEAARRQADAALEQSREDQVKMKLEEKRAGEAQAEAQAAADKADAAEARAAADDARLEQALKTAAAEKSQRLQAEAETAKALAGRMQAVAERQKEEQLALNAAQSAGAIWTTLLPQRLDTLPPDVALKAFQALYLPADSQQPWTAPELRQRGGWRARLGDWTNAAADFSRALDLEPANVKSYDALAALLVQTGETNAYARHCARLLDRFGATNDAALAGRVARDCLFGPCPGAALAPAAALARRSLAADTNEIPLYKTQLTLGLAEYRQGHFAEATNWLGQALAGGGRNAGCDAQCCAALAMAREQLRQTNEAQAALAKGAQLVETRLPKLASGDIGLEWTEWIMAHTLMREASALVTPPPAAPVTK